MFVFLSDIFKEMVKWCLIVTTPIEIMMLAVVTGTNGLQVIPTRFVLPTDYVRMICVEGCKDGSGRVFLGGDDGNLYEMVYSGPDIKPDGSARLSYTQSLGVGAKRIYSLMSGSVEESQSDYCRCYKVNHTSSVWESVLPSMMSSKARQSRGLISVVSDGERRALYTLSVSGEINVYDIAKDLRSVASIKSVDVCRSYVSNIKQGRM